MKMGSVGRGRRLTIRWEIKKMGRDGREDRQTEVVKEIRKGCGNCNIKVENNYRTDKRDTERR
jgi:hypothetical protein